jgi:hypothetical protein
LKMWARNYTKGLVKLVVDGRLDAESGTVVVVRFQSYAPDMPLEIFSSRVETNTTVLTLCSGAALEGVDGVVHRSNSFQSRAPDVPLEIDGIGKWKTGGLRTEFHAAELAVMDTLAQYKRFETGKVPQAVLRTLCSRLSIRYCAEDRVKVLVQRLTPTWIKARARKKLMEVRWTKEAVKKMVPDADLIRHINRHEWCPVCRGPSYNNFLQKVVGGHRRLSLAQNKRFSRRCGDVVVLPKDQYNITSAVAKKMKSWNAAVTTTNAVVGASPLLVPKTGGEDTTGSGAKVATPSTTLTKRKYVQEGAANHGETKRHKGSGSVHRALTFEKQVPRRTTGSKRKRNGNEDKV